MFPITITLHDAQQLNAVMQALGATAAAPAPKAAKTEAAKTETAKTKAEPPVLTAEQQAAVDDTAGLEEVNKGNASGATTARSQPTAGAAVGGAQGKSTDKPEPQSSTATNAGASSAVDYATLQTAVLALHKLDATAAKPIAEAMGFPNFKAMPAERWAEALEKVKAKTEEVKGGV